jgi:hypothetical protein
MTQTTTKTRWCTHCLSDTEQHRVAPGAYQCHQCHLRTA